MNTITILSLTTLVEVLILYLLFKKNNEKEVKQMVKEPMEDTLDEYEMPDEEPEQEDVQEPEEVMEEIKPIEKKETPEQILEKRITKIENVLGIVQKWTKKNSDEIKRLEENFQKLLEDK